MVKHRAQLTSYISVHYINKGHSKGHSKQHTYMFDSQMFMDAKGATEGHKN